jgi:pyridoxine 5-phosphate synthase
VNIDHFATLRQARGESYPCLVRAAEQVLAKGVEQITIHLREDRRHIQDEDLLPVREATQKAGRLLNLEMASAQDIFDRAVECKPDWICFVPEKREEVTTEGGLNLMDTQVFHKHQELCAKVREFLPGTKISLFLEANHQILTKAVELNCDAVEIHTGHFCRLFEDQKDRSEQLERFKDATRFLLEQGIRPHAGHGLTEASLKELAGEVEFFEYNIGHWIVAESLYVGIDAVIDRLIGILEGFPIKGHH